MYDGISSDKITRSNFRDFAQSRMTDTKDPTYGQSIFHLIPFKREHLSILSINSCVLSLNAS